MSSVQAETTALFRAHATARLRGDAAEADRLAAHIGDEQRMGHMLFTLALFTQFVHEELGYEPDRADLAALTARLHEKHYRPGGSFEALRGEAMVRAVTVEPLLLTEIPQHEQSAYMWAVIGELAESEPTDAELAERFTFAEEYGADMLGEALSSPVFEPMLRDAAQPDPVEPERAQTDPGTSASGASPTSAPVSSSDGSQEGTEA